MARVKPVRHAARAVLLVGEGATEKAFLDHLKSLYVPRGCGVTVTVKDAHGKGPENVVNFAFRQSMAAAYDVKAVLMDTDIEWNHKVRRIARSNKICLIGSTPCCDGLMLSILGMNVPQTSDECKAAIVARLRQRPLIPDAFFADFPKRLIDEKRISCATTNKIISVLEGIVPESD